MNDSRSSDDERGTNDSSSTNIFSGKVDNVMIYLYVPEHMNVAARDRILLTLANGYAIQNYRGHRLYLVNMCMLSSRCPLGKDLPLSTDSCECETWPLLSALADWRI